MLGCNWLVSVCATPLLETQALMSSYMSTLTHFMKNNATATFIPLKWWARAMKSLFYSVDFFGKQVKASL
jgi:hypothetical protein